MRVLYVACDIDKSRPLVTEAEITELELVLRAAKGKRISFTVMPGLAVEKLQAELKRSKPDVLHIASHGDGKELLLPDTFGDPIGLTGSDLGGLLKGSSVKLVYLNVCSSGDIARQLLDSVPFAIGTNAPIQNLAARASACSFYSQLVDGKNVTEAAAASKVLCQALSSGSVTSDLYSRDGGPATSLILYQPTRIVAQFHDNDYRSDKSGHFGVEIGIGPCPTDSSHVVFFTPESSIGICEFVKAEPDDGGVVWLEDVYNVLGTFRLIATVVRKEGEPLALTADLCDAIQTYFELSGKVPKPLASKAIDRLRKN